jgi:carbamoyl-phosphate synthase large subunit
MKQKSVFANVLVTAVGGIVGEGIVKSLKLANMSEVSQVKYKIYGADMSSQAAGLYRCDYGVLVPPATSEGYLDSIKRIISKNDIQAVYAGSDIELSILASSRPDLESGSNVIIITNPPNVVETARDKWKTFQFLNEYDLPRAMSCLPEGKDEFIETFGFPMVVKPREGYGSLHFYIVHNRDEMRYAVETIQKYGWNPVIQEYLNDSYQEFTSGVTIDKSGNSIMSSISMRKSPKSGQTYKAVVDSFDEVRMSAEMVSKKLGARGPVNVQAKFDGNEAKVFEINPRLSATSPIRAVAGVNEPDILYRNWVLNESIQVKEYEKMLCLRYWNEIYVTMDAYDELSRSGEVLGEKNSYDAHYF